MRFIGWRAVRSFLLLGLLCISLSQKACDAATFQDIDPVNIVFAKIQTRIMNLMQQATANGLYLEDHGLVGIDLSLQNARALLRDEQRELFRNIDRKYQEVIRDLDRQVDVAEATKNGVLDLEQFSFLDVQDTLNRFPFLGKRYYLTNIKGYSLGVQTTGAYDVQFVGNAFGPDTVTKVTIAGKPVDPSNIDAFQKNICRVSIPVEALKPYFDDTKVTNVPLGVICERKVKKGMWPFRRTRIERFFEYSGKLQCLPVFPVSYTLTEHALVPGWESAGDVSGCVNCARTEDEGGSGVLYTITARIPATWRRDPGRPIVQSPGVNAYAADWIGQPTEVVGPDGAIAYQQGLRYRVHDRDITYCLIVPVQKPSTYPSSMNHTLEPLTGASDSRVRQVANGGTVTNYLTYGNFRSDLTNDFQNYEFTATYFNGQAIADTSAMASNSKHIKVSAFTGHGTHYIEVRVIP